MASGGRSPGTARQVLEKVDKRAYLDDTIPLQATITTYRILQSHVEYTIHVQRGPSPENSWEVNHRYNEFSSLQQLLQVSSVQLPLPPKKMFGNTDRKFLNERQEKLQVFIDTILADPLLALSLPTKRFLDPTNYSEDFHEKAFRTASMFFRSNPEYSVVEALGGIGWRCRKHYYLIASKTESKAPRSLLSLCEPGPDFSLSEKDLEILLKCLVDMKHPNILSPKSATFTGAALMVVREYHPNGSLRDRIYRKKPDQHYLVKYGTAVPSSSLTGQEVRRYGRQILDAMQFLLDKGFVMALFDLQFILIGHIHSGNVILEGSVCKLTDLENSLLGIPHVDRYFTYMHELRKIQSTEAEAVYCFGHMLYEMCSGHMLKTPTMESCPQNVPFDAVPVLESLLSSASVKSLPTISELLSNPFFSEVAGTAMVEKPLLKVSSKVREALKVSKEKAEARLLEYHRKVSQSLRISRAHDSLMSDEKKKERRKKIKKQMSLQDSSQEGDAAYPTSKLTRQTTIATSSPASTQESTKSKAPPKSSSSSSSLPPAPKSQPPEPRSQPPPRKTSERGALLGSIEGFSKTKLKKAVTNDRSGPLLR